MTMKSFSSLTILSLPQLNPKLKLLIFNKNILKIVNKAAILLYPVNKKQTGTGEIYGNF